MIVLVKQQFANNRWFVGCFRVLSKQILIAKAEEKARVINLFSNPNAEQ